MRLVFVLGVSVTYFLGDFNQLRLRARDENDVHSLTCQLFRILPADAIGGSSHDFVVSCASKKKRKFVLFSLIGFGKLFCLLLHEICLRIENRHSIELSANWPRYWTKPNLVDILRESTMNVN